MYKYRFYDVNPVRMITVFHKDRATPTRKLDRNKVYLFYFGCTTFILYWAYMRFGCELYVYLWSIN